MLSLDTPPAVAHLGNDDFLPQNLHGIVAASGFLPHEDDFAEGALTKEFEIIEVIHGLWAGRTHSLWCLALGPWDEILTSKKKPKRCFGPKIFMGGWGVGGMVTACAERQAGLGLSGRSPPTPPTDPEQFALAVPLTPGA